MAVAPHEAPRCDSESLVRNFIEKEPCSSLIDKFYAIKNNEIVRNPSKERLMNKNINF